ncbi:poly [ADP-ribose] polymerase 1-like [Argiope bruennichi]|uniref:poly [ADP-ribose] polymerase 1-like n=1 Tax=Argiope bruennichi TaxID=94029 RepID=UPI002494D9B9|nr:poly [ADP-ribose] polymerase 1-like [Argiope bruennichi]
MDADLPFAVEYAKSGRASCKKCKQNIAKDALRMAIMVQSHMYDGKMPLWHHWKCFFEKKNKLQSISEIANFDNLRWEDQEKIKKKLAGGGDVDGSGDSTAAGSSTGGSSKNSDFSVEYAKSGKSTCRGCGEKIPKGEVRISVLDDNPEHQRYGPAPLWRHVDCFVKDKQQLGFNDSADNLPGFNSLKAEDQKMVKEKVGSKGIKRKSEDDTSTTATKVKKTDQKEGKTLSKEEKILKEQNRLLFDMRDKIAKSFSKKDMIRLLEHNEQHISAGEQRLLDHLADCLVFGALKKCPECKSDAPRFMNNKYVCNGNLTEWTKCQFETKYPERKKFDVPEDFKDDYPFLKDYKCVVKERKFPKVEDANSSKKNLPLSDFKISLFGKFKTPQDVIQKQLEQLGAKIQKSVNGSVNLCISTPNELQSESSKIEKARSLDIHIVSYGFVDAVKKGSPVAQSIKENLLSTWGEDPILKFGIKKEHGQTKSGVEKDQLTKSIPQKVKVTVKGAAAVDPESGLEDTCHVYQKKDNVYNVVLAYVDMSKGTNSFYKLQILESNKGSKYYVFRQWGRVGTTIGGKKVEKFSSSEEAIFSFEALYLEKTGNEWWDRKNFVKKPGCMYPLDIDYGQECEQIKQELKPGENSKLPKPVQELICLIFDIEAMKKAMVEFEIDLKKMPLGKLSKKQMEMAYKVLGEAQQILVTGANNAKITDASNRFFTLIPHDFGMKKPPLLDNEEIIKSKIEMLDSLMEIEFAYNLLKEEHNESKDPVDEHYEKLKTDIEPLPKDSKEFDLVQTYMKNTHAQTHDNYKLKIQEVFKINRHGEKDKYKKFKDLHNKKLLWHGSRLTNYVGILSQGLRIAPPEAPVTGYMFGKGVYFADMVSKSANYCFTSKKNNTGLLLLCEVALGDMYERTKAEFVEKLPSKKHSTLGMGMTVPDPNEKTYIGDVEIPYGKPTQRTNISRSDLLYNEYIVYDTNQINIKYLLKVEFKYVR